VPHYSLTNREATAQPILYFTYVPGPSRYDDYHEDKFNAVPPDAFRTPGKAYRSGNTNVPRAWSGKK